MRLYAREYGSVSLHKNKLIENYFELNKTYKFNRFLTDDDDDDDNFTKKQKKFILIFYLF